VYKFSDDIKDYQKQCVKFGEDNVKLTQYQWPQVILYRELGKNVTYREEQYTAKNTKRVQKAGCVN